MIQCVICEDWYHSRVNNFFIVVQSYPKYHSLILIIYWVPSGFKLWIWELVDGLMHQSSQIITANLRLHRAVYFLYWSHLHYSRRVDVSHSITNLCHKVLVIIIIIIIKIIIIIVSSEINSLSRYVESCNSPLLRQCTRKRFWDVMLKVAKPCHYSKNEKSTLRRNNFVGSFGGTQQK